MSGILNNADYLTEIAKKAEATDGNLVALCGRLWHLPVYKQTLSYELSSMRKPTALEEYIMKAANASLSYQVDKSMLQSLFGLDEVFFEDALKSLAEKKILDEDAMPVLCLTDTGKAMLSQNIVPDKARVEKVEYYIDRKFATVYAEPKDDDSIGVHPGFELIDKAKENIKKYVNRRFLNGVGKALGKRLENPDAGTRITGITSVKTTDSAKTLYAEILLYNIAKGDFARLVWDCARECFHDELSMLIDQNAIPCGYGASLPEPKGMILALKSVASKNAQQKGNSIRVCRESEKDSVIENAFESASKTVVIHIPVLSAEAIATAEPSLIKKAEEGIDAVLSYAVLADNSAKESLDKLRNTIAEKNHGGEAFLLNIVQNAQCKNFEIMADSSVCVLWGIEWARCSGECTAFDDGAIVVCDEEFCHKRQEYWEEVAEA